MTLCVSAANNTGSRWHTRTLIDLVPTELISLHSALQMFNAEVFQLVSINDVLKTNLAASSHHDPEELKSAYEMKHARLASFYYAIRCCQITTEGASVPAVHVLAAETIQI